MCPTNVQQSKIVDLFYFTGFLQRIVCLRKPLMIMIVGSLNPPVQKSVQRRDILLDTGACVLLRVTVDRHKVFVILLEIGWVVQLLKGLVAWLFRRLLGRSRLRAAPGLEAGCARARARARLGPVPRAPAPPRPAAAVLARFPSFHWAAASALARRKAWPPLHLAGAVRGAKFRTLGRIRLWAGTTRTGASRERRGRDPEMGVWYQQSEPRLPNL